MKLTNASSCAGAPETGRLDVVLDVREAAQLAVVAHDLERAPARRAQRGVAVQLDRAAEPVVLRRAALVAAPLLVGDVGRGAVELAVRQAREIVPLEQDLRPPVGEEPAAAFDIDHCPHGPHLAADLARRGFDRRIVQPGRGPREFQCHNLLPKRHGTWSHRYSDRFLGFYWRLPTRGASHERPARRAFRIGRAGKIIEKHAAERKAQGAHLWGVSAGSAPLSFGRPRAAVSSVLRASLCPLFIKDNADRFVRLALTLG